MENRNEDKTGEIVALPTKGVGQPPPEKPYVKFPVLMAFLVGTAVVGLIVHGIVVNYKFLTTPNPDGYLISLMFCELLAYVLVIMGFMGIGLLLKGKGFTFTTGHEDASRVSSP